MMEICRVCGPEYEELRRNVRRFFASGLLFIACRRPLARG